MFLFCVCMLFTVIIIPDLLILLHDSQNFLIHLPSRYVGINATEINHSAGRYHPGQSPPLEAGLEVRVKEIWSEDLRHPYAVEPHLTATSLLWPPCFGHPGKMAIYFLVKKPSLIRSPRYDGQFLFGPLVTILTGFHCITCQLSRVIQNSP